MSQDVMGAWIGGCIDTTGAVIASASIAGTEALNTAAVVKMLQNASIAPISVVVSIWYHRKMAAEENENAANHMQDPLLAAAAAGGSGGVGAPAKIKPSPTFKEYVQLMIARFPKFVLGFLLVSLFISFVLPQSSRESAFSWSFWLSEWFVLWCYVICTFLLFIIIS